MNFADFLSAEEWSKAWEIIKDEFLFNTWETLYATFLATFCAIILGMPLGILLVVGEKGNIMPIPRWLMKTLDVIINILRSVPFVILVILVIPITRFVVGTSIGTLASTVPLIIAAFPFIARLVEGSMREVNPNLIEMAQSMGASPMQIVLKVMIPEAVPSLISNFTLAITTILGYNAMSGTVGGGGIGKIAITYGYNRRMSIVLVAAVILLVILVQIFQTVGGFLAKKADKRLK